MIQYRFATELARRIFGVIDLALRRGLRVRVQEEIRPPARAGGRCLNAALSPCRIASCALIEFSKSCLNEKTVRFLIWAANNDQFSTSYHLA